VNFISLPQEVRGIFVIKAAVEMQNNLPFCIVITIHDHFWNVGQANCILKYFENMMIDHSDSTIF
jgi:tRNA splicing ligase